MARDLVTVARFDIPAKAHMARNALEDAGIRSVLQDEQLVAMDYLLNLAVGGIKLQVWEEDAQWALAVLGDITRTGASINEETGESGRDGGDSLDDQPESFEQEAGRRLLDNVRDRYARRALLAALCSILILPVAFYTAYLLLMALFSEGTLTGARRWGVWIAALVTPVLMLVSPAWMFALFTIISTGRLES